MSSQFTPADLAPDLIALREKCKASPIFLGAHVLGYDYLKDPADFHVEGEKALLANENLLALAPRNHIKTTFFDVVGGIHAVICDPNVRQLLTQATLAGAMKILREIMWHFDNNQRFRMLFPEYAPMSHEERGNQREFTVPCRTTASGVPSFYTAGQDSAITGFHFDIIRCSDLVIRENVPPASTKEQMDRTLEFFRTTSALLDTTNPKAHRTVDGTRWHDGDLYGTLIRDKGYAHFRKIIVGIPEDRDGMPVSIWKHMTRERLIEIRGEVGPYLWAANYRNDPVPAGDAMFPVENFRFYDKEPENLDIAITVDLAISDKNSADYTAIVVSGIDPENDLYVLHAARGRWNPYEVIELLYLLNDQYKPAYVGIESVAWQKAMLFIIEEETRRRGVWMPVKPLIPDGRKERRAWPLAQHAQRRGIYVRREHGELIDEAVRFPAGLHDDLVDALAYRGQDLIAPVLNVNRPPEKLTSVPPTVLKGADLLKRFEEENFNFSFFEE